MWVVFVLRLSVLGAVRIGRCASLLARVRMVRAERAGTRQFWSAVEPWIVVRIAVERVIILPVRLATASTRCIQESVRYNLSAGFREVREREVRLSQRLVPSPPPTKTKKKDKAKRQKRY